MNTGTIIDLAIVGVFIVAIVIGLIKGFNKLFMGFLSEIGALFVAGILSVVTTNALVSIPQIAGISNTFAGWFSKLEFANVAITTQDELVTLLSSSVLSFLEPNATVIWEQMQQFSLTTLAGYAGLLILKAISIILCFVIILIVVRLVLKGIRILFDKLNKLTLFKILNMLMGAVWSVAVTYLIVVVVLLTGAEVVVGKFFETSIPSIQAIVSDSAVLQLLHQSNFIGKYIAQLLSMPLPEIFPPM